MRKRALLLIILGVVAGLGTGLWRHCLEREFNQVEIALDLSDLGILPGQDGVARWGDGDDWQDGFPAQLGQWGVDSLVLTMPLDEPWDIETAARMGEAIRDGGLGVLLKLGKDGDEAILPGKGALPVANPPPPPASPSQLALAIDFIKPDVVFAGGGQVPGYPGETWPVAHLLTSQGIRFGLLEFAHQAGELELARRMPGEIVRVHTIYPKELPQYSVVTASARFVRAVRERSYRLLYIRSLEPGDGRDNRSTKVLVNSIDHALKENGFRKGPASALAPWHNPLPVVLLVLGGWAGGAFLLWRGFRPIVGNWLPPGVMPLANGLALGALGGLALLVLAAWVFFSDILARQILALLIALTFPSLAALPRPLPEGTGRGAKRIFAWATGGFSKATVVSLAGAALVVGALGDYRFMAKIEEFRGVKAMSLLPIVFAGLCVLLNCNLGNSAKAEGRETRGKPPGKGQGPGEKDVEKSERQGPSESNKGRLGGPGGGVPPLWLKGGIVLMAVAGLVIYVGRTGNFIIPVPAWEIRLREFLEAVFPYRPRTKEVFIGHPLFLLGMGMRFMGLERLGLWAAAVGTVGQVSMVNTFTHGHASLVSAVSRTFSGLLVGSALGLVLLALILTWRVARQGRGHPRG